MANKLRSLTEIRRAACRGSLANRARDYFTRVAYLNSIRERLRYPSDRLAAVLEFYGVSKLSDISAADREIAEAVCAHDRNAIIRWSEHYVGGRMDTLGADELVTEFNLNYREELEREIEAVRSHLLPIFQLWGVEGELDSGTFTRFGDAAGATAPPLRELRRHLEFAKPCEPGMGVHTVVSTFRGLFND